VQCNLIVKSILLNSLDPLALSLFVIRILGELVHYRRKRQGRTRVQVHLLQWQNSTKHLRRRLYLQSIQRTVARINEESLPDRQGSRNEPRSILQNTKRLLLGRHHPHSALHGSWITVKPLPRHSRFDAHLGAARCRARGGPRHNSTGRSDSQGAVSRPATTSQASVVVRSGRLPRESAPTLSSHGRLEAGHGLAGRSDRLGKKIIEAARTADIDLHHHQTIRTALTLASLTAQQKLYQINHTETNTYTLLLLPSYPIYYNMKLPSYCSELSSFYVSVLSTYVVFPSVCLFDERRPTTKMRMYLMIRRGSITKQTTSNIQLHLMLR